MNKNGEKTKLLAVIAVFAMVLCAMAVAMPAADAAGDDEKAPIDFEADITVGSETLSNAGLGNLISVEYIEGAEGSDIAGTYVLSGSLNKQNYDGNTGVNQTSAAKAFNSLNPDYIKEGTAKYGEFWGLAFTTNGTASFTNEQGQQSAEDTTFLLYLDAAGKAYNNGIRTVTIGSDASAVKYNIDISDLELLSDSYAAETLTIDDKVSITLKDGVIAKGTVTGTSYNVDFLGNVNGIYEATNDTNFVDTFKMQRDGEVIETPYGYNYITVNGFNSFGASLWIEQDSPALMLGAAYKSERLYEDATFNKDNNGVKAKLYENFNNSLNLDTLIPMTGDKVVDFTVKATEAATTNLATINLDFSGVTYDATVTDADDIADAFVNADTVTVTKLADGAAVTVPENKTLIIENATAGTTGIVLNTTDGTTTQKVTVKNVTIKSMTVTYGSVTIGDTEVDVTSGGEFTVDEKTDMKFTGTIDITGNLTIDASADEATVNILRSATINLAEGSSITFVGGEVSIKGTINGGEIIAGDGSTVTIDGTVTSDVNKTAGGTIVNNTSTVGNITLSDGSIVDNRTSVDGSISQEIIVAGDVTVVSGGHITINGLLTIQEGAVLTLEQGAYLTINASGKVVNDGTIAVEAGAENGNVVFTYSGSSMAVNGTLDLQGENAFNSAEGDGITVAGTMNVGEDATANIKGLTVSAGGNLNINGLVSGEFVNNGTVTVDSENEASNVTVKMRDGAVLNLVNADGVYKVTDNGMKYRNSESKDVEIDADKVTSVTFTNVAGVTVTESLVVKMEPAGSADAVRVGYGNMTISGDADVASTLATIAEGTTRTAGIEITAGTLNVAADTALTLAENVDVTIGSGAVLAVAGSVDVTDDKADIIGAGTLTVTGTVTSDAELDKASGTDKAITGQINAAHYTSGTGTAKVEVYTTLASAIAAGADDIDMLGDVLIEEDITIPAGVDVDATKAKSFKIAEDATVTVVYDTAANSSGKLVNGNNVDIVVEGTLVTEHLKKSNVTEAHVKSDVTTKNGDYAKFTSIYNALAEAVSGDTVTVTSDEKITLDKDITIPAGVTLSVPQAAIDVAAGVTVTVNGTYEGDTDYVMLASDDENDPTQTVVNGMFKILGSTGIYANPTAENVNVVSGAYYSYDGYNVISPLSVLSTVVADVDSPDAKVYGTVTEGDVTITAEEFEIAVRDKAVLTLSSLTLDGVEFDFTQGRTTATVNVADGSFALKNVKGGVIAAVTETANDVTTETAVLTGTIITTADALESEKKELPTGSITVSGTAQIGTKDAKTTIVADGTGGTVTNKAPSVTIAAEADVAVVYVDFNTKVTVDGAVSVEGEVASSFNGDLVVSGTVTVADKTSATAARMYVGMSKDTNGIYNDLGSGSVSGVALAAAPATGDDTRVVYVSPNATFTPVEAQAENGDNELVSTEYFIEDALFVTAYANADNDVEIREVKATITNAYFAGWANEDDEFAFVESTTKDVPDTIRYIGETDFERVYADIEYDIYVINLRADQNAVSSISIDGNLMQFGLIADVTVSYGYYYGYTAVVSAGAHTIQYQLANGYSGEGVLAVNGTAQSGLTFTTEGTPAVGQSTITYNLQLTGFEKSGYVPDSPDTGDSGESDSGMTITDYLLIVLVVLIIVMAIIVAMRLMRS